MPRNRSFRRKIQRIEATISVDSDSDSSNEEDASRNFIRCSTPVCQASVSGLSLQALPSSIDDHPAIDRSLDDSDEIDDADPVYNVLTDSSVGESCDSDSEGAANDYLGKLWNKILSNESCKLSMQDLNVLLVTIQTVYKLPDVAMNSFCKLLSACLPSGNGAPTSYATAVKQLLVNYGDIGQQITYVCSGIACNSTLPKLFAACENIACNLHNKKQHASGFLRLKIMPQIERIVKTRLQDIYHYLSTAPPAVACEMGDIPTTSAYVELGQNPDGNTLWISLILSSDGAQAFKLSRSSFWPFVAIIAELPPTVRVSVENAIGLGFWVGRGAKSKPDWKMFLPPILAEINILKAGFKVDVGGRSIRVCIRLLATIFDLPAQASIWGIKQFNGNFGCFRCLHPGERRGTLCVWPLLNPKPALKDDAFYREAWSRLQCASAGFDYYGVTCPSELARVGNPANVNIFDSMHLVYRGNAQLIFNRLFTSQAQKWTAIFGKRRTIDLDSVVQNVRLPHYFDRKIPSLNMIKTYKASEVKNLLVYAILPTSSPFMENIPDYWHWIAIYVHAIRLLSQPVVTTMDADTAQRLLDIWQQLIPEFCHQNSQNFNSHAVLHLPEQVKRFGPLWSISSFPFEGFNGYFSRFIKASKGVLVQLGRRFALQQTALMCLSSSVRSNQEPLSSVVGDLFPKLYQRWLPRTENERYRLLDAGVRCSDVELSDWIHSRYPDFNSDEFQFSRRASRGSEVLHSIQYSAKTASVVKYTNQVDDLGEGYGEIQIFFSVRNNIYVVVKSFQVIAPTNILQVPPPENELLYSLYDERVYGSFYYIVDETMRLDIISMTDILCSAVFIDCHGTYTVTDLLPFEHD